MRLAGNIEVLTISANSKWRDGVHRAMDDALDIMVRDLDVDSLLNVAPDPNQVIVLDYAMVTVLTHLSPRPVIVVGTNIGADEQRVAFRAGAKDVIPMASAKGSLSDAVREVVRSQTAATDGGAPRGVVVAVCSGRGGSGRTTVAATLALAAAERTNRPTVLVDGNLETGGVGLLFDHLTMASFDLLYPADHDGIAPATGVSHVMQAVNEQAPLYLLAGTSRADLASLVTDERFGYVLDQLRATHSLVVVDLPAGLLNAVTLATLERADAILLVTKADAAGMDASARILEVFCDPRVTLRSKTHMVINFYGMTGGERKEVVLGHVEFSDAVVFAADDAVARAAKRRRPGEILSLNFGRGITNLLTELKIVVGDPSKAGGGLFRR
jgi:MinD-like ATPase involved in chromosome partitioning or flagellar assembly